MTLFLKYRVVFAIHAPSAPILPSFDRNRNKGAYLWVSPASHQRVVRVVDRRVAQMQRTAMERCGHSTAVWRHVKPVRAASLVDSWPFHALYPALSTSGRNLYRYT